jgi:hypothetical protein
MTRRARLSLWLDRMFEWWHHGRPRPATHRRREEEHVHLAQEAIVDAVESDLTLYEEEVNMLWDRHRKRTHGRSDA